MKRWYGNIKGCIAAFVGICLEISSTGVYAAPSNTVPGSGDSLSANDSPDMILSETGSQIDDARAYSDERIVVVMQQDGIDVLQEECEREAVQRGNNELSLVCEEIEESIEGSGEFQFSTIELSDGMTVEEAVDYYGSLPGVAFAQPDYVLEPEEGTDASTALEIKTEGNLMVNDPYADAQWYLEQMHMDSIWEYTQDIPYTKIRVAVVDTGLDVSHPDLQRAVNKELCVSSVNSDFNQITTDLGRSGHGTHIAGIIGATSNNGIGIAGLASDRVELMGICCQTENSIYSSYAARGVEYAVAHGARIINMSLGTTSSDNLLKAAMEYAYSQNVLVVCSAGNTGSAGSHYPSGYAETIGIISVDKNNQKMTTSNYGSDNYLSAPGSSIYSTLPGGRYGYLSGTSMAAGVVSGIAAYVLSLDPTMTVEQLKSVLSETATDTYDEGFDAYSGWGVINPYQAIARMTDSVNTVGGFVNRLYQLVMERVPDAEGLEYWINMLKQKSVSGAEAVRQFIESPEFTSRSLSDEQYITILYRVFMGRDPDSDGYYYWMNLLKNGISRSYVANQFCTSAEFGRICSSCGITAGRMVLHENRDVNIGLTAFMARQYTKALGRNYDVDGINYWTGEILAGRYQVVEVCTDGFFHSKEFYQKNLTDEAYIKVLYQTFFDREYDQEGLQYWLGQLASGAMTRDHILNDFSLSAEFENIRADYGF